MKDGLKKLIILLLVGTLLFAAIGCGGKTDDTDSGGNKGGSDNGASDNGDGSDDAPYDVPLDGEKFKGQTLEIWQLWVDDDTNVQSKGAGKDSVQGRKPFEEATGTTVNVTHLEGDGVTERIISAISAGTGPDLVAFYPSAKPTWMIQNLLLPMSDYADFDDAKWLENVNMSQAVWDYFTYNGKRYGIGTVQLSARIYYNKEMFEMNGLDDPYEQFNAGVWNWDTFTESAIALTQDTDGDGELDQWGFATYLNDCWFFSNGVEYVKYVDGKPVFGLEDEKAYQSLQKLQDAGSVDKYIPEVWWDPSPMQRLYDGALGMCYWGYWEMPTMRENLGDKLGIVPFPAGPGLEGRKSADIAEAIARGIASSSKNPELAASYLKWLYVPNPNAEEDPDAEPAWADYGSEELYNAAIEWAQNAVISPSAGFTTFNEIFDSIRFIGERTPAQAVQEIKQAAQAELDAVFEGISQ